MFKANDKTNKNLVNAVDNLNGMIVAPAVPVSIKNDSPADIGTFYKLSPLFLSLAVSSSRASSRYNLNVTDYKNGFYFEYKELGFAIKVPLSAIFNTNDKIKGILGVAFSTAEDCPSRALNLCQLDDTELCYAVTGERQGTKKSYNYLQGMDSYKNGLLSQYYFNLFYSDNKTRDTLKRYLKYYNIDTLRFNLKGDFKSEADIKCIEYITSWGVNMTGYTARDDLKKPLFDLINKYDNIIINGSNMMYNNQFKVTYNIKDLLTAPYRCKGGCLKNSCLNCYKLKNVIITVLAHGSQAGVRLNTIDNRAFIIDTFKLIGIELTPAELKSNKNLFNGLNNLLVKKGFFKLGLVPDNFLKVSKKGVVKFAGQQGIINFLDYVLKSKKINPDNMGVINYE